MAKAIEAKRAELATIEGKVRLAAVAVQCALDGLSLPAGMSDPTQAYQWAAEQRQRIGNSRQASLQQQAVADSIRQDHLQPLELERDRIRQELKALEAEHQAAKNAAEVESAPEMIADHEAQIKFLQASVKLHQANAKRLNSEVTALRLEQADLVLQEQQADEALAQAVADGKPVDDDQLVSMQARKLALAKRLEVTVKAAQKATQSERQDSAASDQHRSEINRLQSIRSASIVRSALAELVATLTGNGHSRQTVLDQMRAFN
jgi:hypothetical protein